LLQKEESIRGGQEADCTNQREGRKKESRRLKNLLSFCPEEGNAAQIELLVMLVLPLFSVALSGLSLELVLIGTLTQVQLTYDPHNTGFAHIPQRVPIRLATTPSSILQELGLWSFSSDWGYTQVSIVFHDVLHVPQLVAIYISIPSHSPQRL